MHNFSQESKRSLYHIFIINHQSSKLFVHFIFLNSSFTSQHQFPVNTAPNSINQLGNNPSNFFNINESFGPIFNTAKYQKSLNWTFHCIHNSSRFMPKKQYF